MTFSRDLDGFELAGPTRDQPTQLLTTIKVERSTESSCRYQRVVGARDKIQRHRPQSAIRGYAARHNEGHGAVALARVHRVGRQRMAVDVAKHGKDQRQQDEHGDEASPCRHGQSVHVISISSLALDGYGSIMASIMTVTTDAERSVVRRLFGEYRRGVERLLDGTDVCP